MVPALLALALLVPPILLTPSDTITVSSSRLEWQAPSYSLYSPNPYRVQVDDDSAFSSINKDYYTNNTYYTPTLSLGNWNWRVKAKDSSGSWSDWSNAWSFMLVESTPSPSPTPTPSPPPTPTPTASPTSTPSPTPTKTPSPSPTPKKTATPTPTPTSTPAQSPTLTPSPTLVIAPAPKNTPKINYRIASVAAVSTESGTPASGSSKIDIKNQKQTNPFFWAGLLFILIGAGSVGYIILKQNEKLHFPFRR